jgi:hypothetical protein
VIDFSAIETEIMTLVSGAATFKSTNTGRIRETVNLGQMPSADVSCTGHRSANRLYPSYEADVMVAIRSASQDRNTNVNAFKVLVENVCNALEGVTGTSFDVIRNITSRVGEDESGDGKVVRVAVVTFTVLKD